MSAQYDLTDAVIYKFSTSSRSFSTSFSTSSGVGSCDGFWDPKEARICHQYLLLVSAIPFAFAVLVILQQALSLLIPFKPRWMQPFVTEYLIQQEVPRPLRKYQIRFEIIILTILSTCGFVSAALVAWHPHVVLRELFPAITWAVILSLVLILRPRTASKSLLMLYCTTLLCQAIIYVEDPPHTLNTDGLTKVQLIVGPIAIITLLNMSFRDPRLPKDEISKVGQVPASHMRSPEDSLTVLQFLTVSWMAPMIAMGSARQINDEDVWSLPWQFQHTRLHDKFREMKGSVIGRVVSANAIDLILQATFGLVSLLANLSTPVLLQQLLRAMQRETGSNNAAITYAAISCAVRLIDTQMGVLTLWYGRRCYERSRGEMVTMLFEKTLRRKVIGTHINAKKGDGNAAVRDQVPALSSAIEPSVDHSDSSGLWAWLKRNFRRNKASVKSTIVADKLESASMGKVLNLMRGDVYEVAQRFWEFDTLITKPIGTVLAIVLIWQIIGWPCLIGVATVLVGQGMNVLFARQLFKWEKLRRSATDDKLKRVSQFVESIRHLRWYGWQDTWCKQILEARQKELGIRIITGLWGVLIAFVNELASSMFPVAAFWAYTSLAGLPLTVDIAFPALQVFSILEANLRDLPDLITALLNAKIAVDRIEVFMNEPDMDENPNIPRPGYRDLPDDTTAKNKNVKDHAPKSSGNSTIANVDGGSASSGTSSPISETIQIKHASFAWPGANRKVLKDINLNFSPGLSIVCGSVGAGKTALLQALIGELDQKSGDLYRSGEMIGYCAQTPWLQSMSIKDNILFSAPFENERYQRVVEACALTADFANLKNGDRSNIGENGVGLSGGQKARVALARAVYSQARVLLLDDPISALDHQTAEYIVKKCLTGKLVRGRTVVLVTHRLDICRGLADQVIAIADGQAKVLDSENWQDEHALETTNVDDEDDVDDESDNDLNVAKFIELEHRAAGGVKARVYWEYIKAGKLRWWASVIICLALWKVAGTIQSWFLKEWGEAYNRQSISSKIQTPVDSFPPPAKDVHPWLVAFAVIAVVKSVFYLWNRFFYLAIVYTAGRHIFRVVMEKISHSTFRFYDVTPVGRLMNRLTSDINTIDGSISSQFTNLAFNLISWITAMVVIASIAPLFLVFSIFLTAAFFTIFLWFLPTSQSLRRLEMVSLSPLMSNFGALVDGLVTVRAFCAQHRFQQKVIEVTDNFQKMDHFYWSLQAWLMYCFDLLADICTFILTLIAIYTNISAGLTAFVLLSATSLIGSTHTLCRYYGQLQMDFVSVERVVELLDLEQEEAGSIDPPAWWPSLSGDIVFDNVTIRYAPHLEPSLLNLNIRIPAGSTTAIIGRTGSGKSTLAMALLATVLPSEGSIVVDNISITSVNVQALRERITFVAQDPILFPGTMRQNLDPMSEYDDAECERVLERIAGKFNWTINMHIEAGGKNLSQGQRQLIGLARTILRQSAIVILDEATASIDMETAEVIQDILHTEMKGKTIICVAHRLEAVKNAEYCVVLDKGQVVQQGKAEDVLAGRF